MAHIDRSEIVRAAVWIPVTDPALDLITEASRHARQRAGGPIVKPHLTLLSGIESTHDRAEAMLRKLAVRLEPFIIRLGNVEWRHEYFRCLYVAAESSEALMAAKRLAHEMFEMLPPDPFEPHVSLIYGDIHDAAKRQIAAELGGRIETQFRANSLQLTTASRDRPVTAWEVLMERPLGRRQPEKDIGGEAHWPRAG